MERRVEKNSKVNILGEENYSVLEIICQFLITF